jgi:tetratricopeptide (TPR) repeat protein
MTTCRLARTFFALSIAWLCSTAASAQNQTLWKTYFDQCIVASDQANWSAVDNFCQAALTEADKFGNRSGQAGDIHNVYGTIFNNLARYPEAERHLQLALSIRERKVNDCNNCLAVLAETQSNLGNLYRRQGRLSEAETMLRKALALSERTSGRDDSDVAIKLTNLAIVLNNQNKNGEAEALYQRAMAILERSAPVSIALASTYNSLGVFFAKLANQAEAIHYCEKALQLRLRLLPPNHPDIAISYNNLGDSYLGSREYDKALPLLEKSWDIRRISLANDHPDLGQTQGNIGRALAGLGRYAEAEPHLRDALKRREASYGKNSAPVAFVLAELAGVLRATKRVKEAVAMEKRAANIR